MRGLAQSHVQYLPHPPRRYWSSLMGNQLAQLERVNYQIFPESSLQVIQGVLEEIC